MKITKKVLRQLIREELESVLSEGFDAQELRRVANSAIKCASSDPFKGLACAPHGLSLLEAIASENWFGALKAAKDLNSCVPDACKDAMAGVITMIKPLVGPRGEDE